MARGNFHNWDEIPCSAGCGHIMYAKNAKRLGGEKYCVSCFEKASTKSVINSIEDLPEFVKRYARMWKNYPKEIIIVFPFQVTEADVKVIPIAKKYIKTQGGGYDDRGHWSIPLSQRKGWHETPDILGKVSEMPISEINTRFNEGAPSSSTVLSLMESIKKKKVVPPILVSPNKFLQDGRHRLQAYKNLGYEKVPVIFGYDPGGSGIMIGGKVVELEEKTYRGQRYKTPKKNPRTAQIGQGWHEAPDHTGKAPKHVIAAAQADLNDILRQPIQIVKKIEDKGYPTSDSDYLPSHKLAEAAEKSVFGTDSFNKLEEIIDNKLPDGQLLGTHEPGKPIQVSSIVPEELIPEVVLHEAIETKLMDADGGTDIDLFVTGKTTELIQNGKPIAIRTKDFVFITKDISPNQIPELYKKLNTTYSGGSVSLGLKGGYVIIKDIDAEIKKHEKAAGIAGNDISKRMHVQILTALKELNTFVGSRGRNRPMPSGWG